MDRWERFTTWFVLIMVRCVCIESGNKFQVKKCCAYFKIIRIVGLLQDFSYQYIYTQRNVLVDQLYKEGLHVGDTTWDMWEVKNDTINQHDLSSPPG